MFCKKINPLKIDFSSSLKFNLKHLHFKNNFLFDRPAGLIRSDAGQSDTATTVGI